MNQYPQISVIIAAYNEETTIKSTITRLKNELSKLTVESEIIVINDASTDQTLEKIKEIENIKTYNQPYNKGKGAAQKFAAKVAKFDWLLFFDADGQHREEYLSEMLKFTDQFDLIAGERIGYQGPKERQLGKKIIHLLARYLLGKKINDFNCGFRLVKKQHFLRFAHILPNGFSCDTTSVFAFYKEGLNIKFVPMEINKRGGGKSLVKPKEAFVYLMLIFRLIMLFSPLRIFVPISFILFIFGLALLIFDIIHFNISEVTVFALISSLLIFLFGLIADQLAAVRREINQE